MNKKEWLEICNAYCEKYNYKLVFASVENLDVGFEYNGQFYKHNIRDMEQKLKGE